MEARTEQFQRDAQKARDPNRTPKEIERLRKFLFKNQERRLTEREQSHLFSAVQCHFSAYQDCTGDDAEPALGLLEDALKMPFTVFTTSHKKTFLKWHAKLQGQADCEAAPEAAAGSGQLPVWQVIDASGATITVMAADGTTVDVACSEQLAVQVRGRFDGGDDVSVQLDSGRKAIVAVV